MIEGIPRISVRVITYKQEELIKRAINSLLAQKDYIYEICVSDDCSPDRTWEVLQEYDKKYPGLFKLNRNAANVGMFKNSEITRRMVTGDIVYVLSGDDECGQGWFQKVIEYIQENKIDYKNELFCIYGNYMAVYPNGDKLIFNNKLILNKDVHAFTLGLRHLIGGRSACTSINIQRRYKELSDGASHKAEEILDRQLQICTETNYYIDHIGNIYHVGVGVSAKMKGRQTDEKIHNERQQLADYTIEKAAEIGYEVNEKEKNYMYFTKALFQAKYTHKWSDYYEAFKYYVKSYDPKIGLKGIRFKRMFFAIRRRLPHKNPIIMTV